jgi:hypothetical protein
MNSSALVPGNFFQVIATGGGGPIAVNGILGSLTLTVNMVPANPNAVVFDLATGRLIVTSINPFGPVTPSNVATFGCNANASRAAKSVFKAALISSQQVTSGTIAGQIAIKILESNICSNLALLTPTFYGAMTDFAFLGERSLASQVWNRVSTFTTLDRRCCKRLSLFAGYLQTDARDLHRADLTLHDIFAGIDYRTCYNFSVGLAVADPFGKIRGLRGDDHINGITGLGYIKADFKPNLTLYGTIVGSHLSNDVHRPTLFGNVKSHPSTASITGFLGLQYLGKINRKFSIAPRANLIYSHAHVGRFKEKGEIDALEDSGFNAALLTSEIGFSALYTTPLARRPFGLEMIAGVELPILSYKNNMKMQIVESPNIDFTLLLPSSTKTRVRGGLNAGYLVWDNTTLNAGYQLISGGNWDHLFTVGLRVCL